MELDEIFVEGRSIEDTISDLKEKDVDVTPWSELSKEYIPSEHEIMTDKITRKDKTRKDGTVEKVARVTYGSQRMYSRRMTQMAFSIPVARLYDTGKDEERKAISDAIEKIYEGVRIDALNTKRWHAYFASCEVLSIWYAVKAPNEDYGFKSDYKLRCISYSPMDRKYSRIEQAELYPLFNNANMIAMSFEYTKREKDNDIKSTRDVQYFECYTSKKHYVWKKDKNDWIEITAEDIIVLSKIPAIYQWRPIPIWEDATNNTKEIEYTLSRQSDIIRKNSAPILTIKGKLINNDKPESDVAREVYQMEGENTDIRYVTWTQQVEATKFYTDTLKKNMDEELQLPNLSLENTKGLGAISGEARKTLLTDAHLKVGEESGDIIEFLDRECNVVKAFLELINTKWKGKTSSVNIKHKITPFIQNDEDADITKIAKATGGEPIASRMTGIRRLGWVEDSEAENALIEKEQAAKNITDVFEPTE
jgi:hypothetical protein